jgi:hypothetical protein
VVREVPAVERPGGGPSPSPSSRLRRLTTGLSRVPAGRDPGRQSSPLTMFPSVSRLRCPPSPSLSSSAIARTHVRIAHPRSRRALAHPVSGRWMVLAFLTSVATAVHLPSGPVPGGPARSSLPPPRGCRTRVPASPLPETRISARGAARRPGRQGRPGRVRAGAFRGGGSPGGRRGRAGRRAARRCAGTSPSSRPAISTASQCARTVGAVPGRSPYRPASGSQQRSSRSAACARAVPANSDSRSNSTSPSRASAASRR